MNNALRHRLLPVLTFTKHQEWERPILHCIDVDLDRTTCSFDFAATSNIANFSEGLLNHGF
ncbi:hypothetical protein RSK20926_10049 [Roseobacter sp. SK209-2-6]|nr:hypothetical protein RSK20926_10049 [Roseobacter sp. SK209-2-6]